MHAGEGAPTDPGLLAPLPGSGSTPAAPDLREEGNQPNPARNLASVPLRGRAGWHHRCQYRCQTEKWLWKGAGQPGPVQELVHWYLLTAPTVALGLSGHVSTMRPCSLPAGLGACEGISTLQTQRDTFLASPPDKLTLPRVLAACFHSASRLQAPRAQLCWASLETWVTMNGKRP